jgi:putative membrane protein
MKKTFALAIALIGLVAGTAVVISLGAGHILQALLKLGWAGLAYVLAWQLAVYVALGLAWWALCPGASPWVMVWGRLVREGGETCLPFSEIGGLVFGARAIMLRGVDLVPAATSSIVDVISEGIGLAPFLLFGLIMLLIRDRCSSFALAAGSGLALLLLGGAVAYGLRRQLERLLHAASERLLRQWDRNATQRADELQHALERLFGEHGRVAAAAIIHLLCWCGGGGNIWIAYHLLGARPGLIAALAIESIVSAALALGFLVPGALGVQELTYVGVGRLFGMPAQLSLALSLIRRARDIIIGAPALLIWQGLEARALRRH